LWVKSLALSVKSLALKVKSLLTTLLLMQHDKAPVVQIKQTAQM